MKILFILDDFLPENSGGAANVAFWLAKGLIKSGHKLLVLTATFNPENVGEIEIEGVKIRKILSRPFGRLRNFKNLKNRLVLKEAEKVFKEYRPDIVHIHTLHHRFSYGIIGLAKQFSKAVFLTLHDAQTVYNGKLFPKRKICDLNPEYDYKLNLIDRLKRDGLVYNPFQRFFIKKSLSKLDKIFAVSGALKEAVEANGVSNVEIIHNGIDDREWIVGEVVGNNILFAGRVDDAKGVKVLISAFRAVSSEVSDAKLTIVGDGGLKADANKNITILPWQSRESMKKLFSEAALVVVPSLYLDPFPTVNLEAMAAGRPVIGTCFGGTREAVVNNETGYIVNPYDEKELAAKIIDLLKNPEKAAAFGASGRERVEKMFSLESQVKKTLMWYENITKKIN
ncbi:MAG: glycosyltransferase family 4 protein [Candidatus Azambacteria bacterium]|nr:glycosyltransferase family 4 protein [Candidatus Azambacteria bacterium]